MAGTIQVRSYHGTTADAGTDVSAGAVRFKLADNDTVDAVTPIAIPGAGTAYSWIKHLALHCTVAPSNAVNNCKFYTDGANGLGTGVTVMAKISTYLNPTSNAATALTGTSDVFTTYGSVGAALAIPGSIGATTGKISTDFVQCQMNVASTATQGTTATETFTFSYDES